MMAAVLTLLLAPAPLPVPVPAIRAVTAADLLAVRTVDWNERAFPIRFFRDGSFRCDHEDPIARRFWSGTWRIAGERVLLVEQQFHTDEAGVTMPWTDPYEATLKVYLFRGKLQGTGWAGRWVIFRREP